jgi:hypothetical protein
MTSTTKLSGAHLRTYQAIFRHPLSHNLGWHEVYAMLRELGQVEEEPNGNRKVTFNGHTLVLHPPHTKEVAHPEELMALRHFLEVAEAKPAATPARDEYWLLVIDHHAARLFRSEMHGAVPQKLLPHEPGRYFRHEQNSQNLSRGKEKPEPNSFFEPVAQALQGAHQILVFGPGTGMGSEMDQFTAWVNLHHPDLATRIVGKRVVDEHHLTEGQLLAQAREFYANLPLTPG